MPGSPFSIGSGSRGAITTCAAQPLQAYFGRTCSSTIRRGRDVFELLADLLADLATLAAALGAGTVFGATRRGRSACGAGSPAAACGRGPGPWASPGPVSADGGCGGRRLGLGEDLLREEQELVGVDLLGLLAVALAQELFELVLELGDEVGLLPQGLGQLADLAVGGVEVVGECRVVVRHTFYYGDT